MITATLLLALGVTIELPSEAHVRGAELSLGAIAQVTGDDPAQVARVQAVRLGYAPAPGYSRLLQAARVLREVEAQAAGVALRFEGSTACRVWPEVEVVRGAALEAAARAELASRLGTRDATLELVQPLADLQVPAGDRPLALSAQLPAGDLAPGQVSLPVQVSVDGAQWRNVWTTWRVQIFEARPVLTRDVAAGVEITADMLTRRRVAAKTATALSEAMLIGATLTRAKQAGEELEPSDVVRAVLVPSGATLMLEIRKGAVSARVAVTAEEAGARGDRIRVRTLDTERTLRATVLARDLVRIDLGQGS